MCIFGFSGTNSGPRHLHHEQDEWVYVVKGEFRFEVGFPRVPEGKINTFDFPDAGTASPQD